ncbi:Hypothetical predicted protein, partial [Paramuricea clavata]
MEGVSRYITPLTAEEERLLVASTIPKNTGYNIKRAVNVFEPWQSCREDKTVRNVPSSSVNLQICQVGDLTTPLHCMNTETLNLWLSRIVEEVCNAKGERYPARRLYVIICSLKRYLSDKSGLDPLFKDDKRFTLFRKVFDGEVRDAAKKGVE